MAPNTLSSSSAILRHKSFLCLYARQARATGTCYRHVLHVTPARVKHRVKENILMVALFCFGLPVEANQPQRSSPAPQSLVSYGSTPRGRRKGCGSKVGRCCGDISVLAAGEMILHSSLIERQNGRKFRRLSICHTDFSAVGNKMLPLSNAHLAAHGLVRHCTTLHYLLF